MSSLVLRHRTWFIPRRMLLIIPRVVEEYCCRRWNTARKYDDSLQLLSGSPGISIVGFENWLPEAIVPATCVWIAYTEHPDAH